MNNCLSQIIGPPPLSQSSRSFISPPPHSVKVKSDQLFFSDDLTLEVPIVTNINFLLTISIHSRDKL